MWPCGAAILVFKEIRKTGWQIHCFPHATILDTKDLIDSWNWSAFKLRRYTINKAFQPLNMVIRIVIVVASYTMATISTYESRDTTMPT